MSITWRWFSRLVVLSSNFTSFILLQTDGKRKREPRRNIIDGIVRKYNGPMGSSLCRNSWILVKIGSTSLRKSKYPSVFCQKMHPSDDGSVHFAAISDRIFSEGNEQSNQPELLSVPNFDCRSFAVSEIGYRYAWSIWASVDQNNLVWQRVLLFEELDLWRNILSLLRNHQCQKTIAT